MGRKYLNPPLVEAYCEFRLPEESDWDLTIPGLLYEKLKTDFPEKGQRTFKEVEYQRTPQGTREETHLCEQVQFSNSDGNISLRVGPRFLVVNCAKPYPTWDVFRPNIGRILQAFKASINFKSFEEISLHYVNKIDISGNNIELRDYFGFRPFLGENLPVKMSSFMLGALFPYEDENDSCRLQLTNIEPENGEGLSYLLDIYYFSNEPERIEFENVPKWLENAHNKIEMIFEGCISDKLRKSFEEVI